MEKKTLYALGAFVVLAVLAIIVMKSPEKGERVGDRPRPVPEIAAGTIATLEITQPGGKDKVTITKSGDKWQVTAPYNKPADQQAVKSAVEALEKLKWGDITTQQKERHAEMEVTDDKAVHVVAKDTAGKVLADLYIGKAAGSATMVRVAGKDDVWQAPDLSTFVFKKEGKLWRDHTIFEQKPDEAEKVVLIGGGTAVTLERIPAQKGADGKEPTQNIYDAKWKVVEMPDPKAMKPDPSKVIDDGVVNGIAAGLAGLRAGEFLDNGKPEEFGLGPGSEQTQIKVAVTFRGGKTIGIRVGQLKGEDYHVQALDSPQLFSVKKYSLERIAHLPQDIRDKTITQIKADQIDQVTIQQGTDTVVIRKDKDTWKADKVADQDDGKVKAVAESFDALSGTGFVAPGAPELESLKKPKATVTIKPKAGQPVVLRVGDTKGDDTVVQKVGQEPMWVKKYNVERFVRKPSDLVKEKTSG